MWGKYNIEKNNILRFEIGEGIYHLCRRDKDFRLSFTRTKGEKLFDFSPLKTDDLFNEDNWQIFICDNSGFIHILPSMPDRPVMLEPQNKIYILPNKSEWFYIPIPVWVLIYSGAETMNDGLMIKEPAVKLSGTWFGEPDNGILSYSLDVPVSIYPEEVKSKGFQVTCPIQVFNESDSILKIDRLLIQTEYLRIYSNNSELFTNEIKVKYEGELNPSYTQFGKNSPSIAKDLRLLVEERIVPSDNLLKRSFLFLKSGKSNF